MKESEDFITSSKEISLENILPIWIIQDANDIGMKESEDFIRTSKEISLENILPIWIIQDAKDMFKLCIPLMQ